MSQEEILKMIEKISPHAKDYVYSSIENNKIEILYSMSTENNKGVFIKVDNDDCCIFYVSFLNEDYIDDVLEIIKNKINEIISELISKEICFNIYGNNQKIIDLARELGFKSDIEGYHLQYMGEELPQLSEHDFIEKGFESSFIDEFVDLFDSSYYELSKDNGWRTDGHAAYKEQFHKKLDNLNKHGQVRSFWLSNELAGAYIFEQNYITDIVVKPVFQGKGYGCYLLAHCIRNMSENKDVKNIRLRVAKSNVGAKRLYERNGFAEIACFAEHTYCR